MKLNSFQVDGEINDGTKDGPPIPFCVQVWPGRRTIVLSPPAGKDYVNLAWLREILATVRREIANETGDFCFLEEWHIYVVQQGRVVKVREIEGGDFAFAPLEPKSIRDPAVRSFVEHAVTAQANFYETTTV
jgi:hypothetical protein